VGHIAMQKDAAAVFEFEVRCVLEHTRVCANKSLHPIIDGSGIDEENPFGRSEELRTVP